MDIRETICLNEILKEVRTVAITGHVRPDGDCIGACLGLWNYLSDHHPEIVSEVFLEPIPERFLFLKGADLIRTQPSGKPFDLVFCLDCGTKRRLGQNAVLLEHAGRTVCIDHHIRQDSFCDLTYVEEDASSASELICLLLGTEGLSLEASEALYMGIAHDTGVFAYSCTSSRTMRVAGELMDRGIPYSEIIAKTFYEKNYYQKQILGKALLESFLMCGGKVICSVIHKKDMKFFGLTAADLDGIVTELRDTSGVEVAIFLTETGNMRYKASLRSSGDVDVNQVCTCFGGGGHVKAAGCEMNGSWHDAVNNLTQRISLQL